MRLVCLSQTQIRPGQTKHRLQGPAPIAQHPTPRVQDTPNRLLQAEAAGPGGPLEGGSSEEAEEKEIRLFSSLPSKTSRGRGLICGLTFALFMVLTKGILKMWPLLCFPLGLHLWLTTETRGLHLGHSATWAQLEGCCFQSRGQVRWRQGVHWKNEAEPTKGLLDTAGVRPGLRQVVELGPEHQPGWGESETPGSHQWQHSQETLTFPLETLVIVTTGVDSAQLCKGGS